MIGSRVLAGTAFAVLAMSGATRAMADAIAASETLPEIAVIGNEGVVGISLFMGGESTPSHAVVQSAGQGYRLKAPFIKKEFNRSDVVMRLLLRYTQALITQIAQTAVCNRHHSIDQRLCRLLLLRLDRLNGDELVMTQELISNMLGVRRESVTESALKLQKAGLIRYFRGHVAVLDRKGLEERTCECYAVVKTECRRLLPKMTTVSMSDDADRADISSRRSVAAQIAHTLHVNASKGLGERRSEAGTRMRRATGVDLDGLEPFLA